MTSNSQGEHNKEHARAVIYVRVSSEEQAKRGAGLEVQEDACRAYCKQQGWEIVEIFRDEGESAKTADRPQFIEMIKLCNRKAARIQFAVVHKLDRFARNAEDQLSYQGALVRGGTELISATENLANDATGRLVRTLLAGIAQFDNEVRADRTRAAMAKKMSAGQWMHRAPIGYVRVAGPGDTRIMVQDEQKGPLVRRAFELVADHGYTLTEVGVYLRENGVQQHNGKPISNQRVQDMLLCRVYCGQIVGSLTDHQVVKGNFEPIISVDLFDRAQAGLLHNGHVPTPHSVSNPDFPLRQFVRCAKCGKPMSGHFAKGARAKYKYYRCYTPACQKPIRCEKLDTDFAALLDALGLQHTRMIQVLGEAARLVWEQEGTTEREEVRARKAMVSQLEQRRARLLDKLLDTTISDDDFRQRDKDIQNQISVLKAKDSVEEKDALDLAGVLRATHYLAGAAGQVWLCLPLNARQRLQSLLFPEGFAYGPEEGARTLAGTGFFNELREISGSFSDLAPPSGFEPLFPG